MTDVQRVLKIAARLHRVMASVRTIDLTRANTGKPFSNVSAAVGRAVAAGYLSKRVRASGVRVYAVTAAGRKYLGA